MVDRRMVNAATARELFERIEPELYRYPAIDPAVFRANVEGALG